MSDTEYEFRGLDEWEQRLFQAVEREYPEEFKKMVIQMAAELKKKVKENTPVKTGYLRNQWRVGEIRKRGNEYYIEVYNDVEYAEPVEYGHRKNGGYGIVKGVHMMEMSLQELQQKLPDVLREWLDRFLDTHEM